MYSFKPCNLIEYNIYAVNLVQIAFSSLPMVGTLTILFMIHSCFLI